MTDVIRNFLVHRNRPRNEREQSSQKRRKKKKGSFKSEFKIGQNTITRDKREFLLRETTDDQRQSQAEICLPFNGTVSRLLFFFRFCVITSIALANRGNRPRDRRFPRKLNISSVTWPHNFSLPHDARLSPRIIPRDTFDPVTFPSRYSRHEGSFFHSRTPNLPPPSLLSNRRSFLKRNPIVSAVRLSARDCSTILYVNERTIFDKKAIISSISFNYTEA